MALVSLETAKAHLRETAHDIDADLDLKLEAAEAIVLGYIARPSDEDWTATIAGWTEATVPAPVRMAILIMVADLWRDRGDEDPNLRQRSAQELGDLPQEVSALLKVTGYRSSVVA